MQVFRPSRTLLLLAGLIAAAAAQDAAAPPLALFDPAALDRLAPSSAQVVVTPSTVAATAGALVTINPGEEGYPGVRLTPPGPTWDLSAYGHVEARLTNVGERPLFVAVRVDNTVAGQQDTWNTENFTLQPGEAGTRRVIFGKTYGYRPGYALDPSVVTAVLVFTTKTDVRQQLRIETITAGGAPGEEPPVAPEATRTLPRDGYLFGGQVEFDPAKHLAAKPGTVATVVERELQVDLPGDGEERWVDLKPAAHRWNLNQATAVTVRLRNTGAAPLVPTVSAISDAGPTASVAPGALAPGASTDVIVPFAAAVPWQAAPIGADGKSPSTLPGTGTRFRSDAVGAVRVAATATAATALVVEAITAGLAPQELPAWLGQRPPVDGDWRPTLTENFDGPTIDDQTWNIVGPNYWDKVSRWSRDNTFIRDGRLILHYEKRRGRHNDEERGKEADYTSGYLDSYGKWVQRYGYLETRIKPPTAPGLWPAFWMMPDRGAELGGQGARSTTDNGGMEFDIWEPLTRWGPHRYNIAVHWDGYGEGHRSTGTSEIYVTPDAEGFYTVGLLWTPGELVWYAQGKEIGRWADPRVTAVPMYFIVDLVAGGWDNNAVDDAKLPDDLTIDYIRVWQRSDLASAVDGHKEFTFEYRN